MQFAPALLIAFGALSATIGGFWQSYRQSSFNAAIREKNDQIIVLQQENLNAVTGGDSFVEMRLLELGQELQAPTTPAFFNRGKYPLYDVTARIVDLDLRIIPTDSDAIRKLMGLAVNIGELAPNQPFSNMQPLSHSAESDINYNIFYSARNGHWTQFLRMKWTESGWSVANRIEQNGKDVLVEVSPDFPKLANGEPDWEYYLQNKTNSNTKP